jgi:hypothetical protein
MFPGIQAWTNIYFLTTLLPGFVANPGSCMISNLLFAETTLKLGINKHSNYLLIVPTKLKLKKNQHIV